MNPGQLHRYEPVETNDVVKGKAFNPRVYLPLIFAIRFVTCMFLMRNYDYPDQYWQGPEIAHKLTFGYGYQTWEWTMEQPIRNHVFPLLLCIPYQLLKLLKLDNTDLLIYAPKFLQVIISCFFDYFLLKLNNLYNPGTAVKLLILNYTSWFSLTMMSRIYINSFESLLTIVGFYYWNLRSNNNRYDTLSRVVVIINFVVRGTSVMFWAVVWPYQLFTMKGTIGDKAKFILKNLLTIGLMLSLSLAFSFAWHGRPTLVQYNFVHYNIILKWSQLYGKLPLGSYFYMFLPFILGGHIPFFYHGVKHILSSQDIQKGIPKLKELFYQCILIMVFLSTSSHKQPRFLLFLLPMYLIICVSRYQRVGRPMLILSIIVNLTIFSFHNLYGKNGSLLVLDDLRHDPHVQTIMFLTECHFTPMYSNIHHNVPIRFPDCSPISRVAGVDQNSQMFKDPKSTYQKMLKDFAREPSHLVVEGIFEQRLQISPQKYIRTKTYRNCAMLQQLFMGYNNISIYKKI